MSTCVRDTPTIRPSPACLLMKLALNHAVLSRRNREHVCKEPRSARNAMYLLLSSSRLAPQSFIRTIKKPCVTRRRRRHRRSALGLVMDVRDLTTFEDGTFDVAIDKGKGAFGWAWTVVCGLGLMICAERYYGRDDDCQGRRVGELPLPCTYHRKNSARQRPHSPPAPQDPPQQVIDDCTKEVDEVVRYGITISPSLSLHRRGLKRVRAVGFCGRAAESFYT